MKLRTFVIAGAIAIISVSLGIFSYQTGAVFERGSDAISRQQSAQLSTVVRAALKNRLAVMTGFSRIIQKDNDLASAFVLAQENQDFRMVTEKINKIRTDAGFDVAEILPLVNGVINSAGDPAFREVIEKGHQGQEGFAAHLRDSKYQVIHFSPLELYGSRVAVLILGYNLDGPLKSDLEDLSKSRVSLRLTSGIQNQPPQESADPSVGLLMIPLSDSSAIEATITPRENIAKGIDLSIRSSLYGAAAVTLIVLVLSFYFVLELGFLRSFGNLVNRAKLLADQVDRDGDLDIPAGSNSWIYETKGLGQVLAVLAHSIQDYRIRIQERSELDADLKRRAALTGLASQVAHDIRSPLAALDSVVNRLAQLPEQERVFMRSAINRIKDIANNLLQKNRKMTAATKTAPQTSEGEPTTTQLLSSLLDPLVTEKRMQFRSKIGIEIDGRIDATSYGLFASVQPTEFKRVISNLINNAVEVLGETGAVVLSVLGFATEIEISIRDNGKGIPPEILAKLGSRGETHGKEGGSGLGLFHARTSVESWGGKLSIQSEVGKGTSVIITLPRSPAPDWFVSTLNFEPGSSVVILDDDSSIHQIWQGRLDSHRVSERQIEIIHVSTPDQFRAWIKENPCAAAQALYLTDYELLGYQDTGLSLIDDLKLGPQSILVTSRFEEPSILEGCQRLKVRMIPKGMAGFVPFSFVEPLQTYDAILLDDDDLVHLNWSSAAKHGGKSLKAFFHPDQFFAMADTFAKSSPVYVDANLGQGIKGEIVAEKVHSMGFKRVYLATGYEPETFKNLRLLQGVIGKEPPESWFTPPSA